MLNVTSTFITKKYLVSIGSNVFTQINQKEPARSLIAKSLYTSKSLIGS